MLSDTMLLLAMDSLPMAISIFNQEGVLLYYNRPAAVLLDRKPAYIGQHVCTFLNEEGIKSEVDYILKSFKLGRLEPFTYQAQSKDKPVSVTVSPLLDREERFLGCVEYVVAVSDPE